MTEKVLNEIRKTINSLGLTVRSGGSMKTYMSSVECAEAVDGTKFVKINNDDDVKARCKEYEDKLIFDLQIKLAQRVIVIADKHIRYDSNLYVKFLDENAVDDFILWMEYCDRVFSNKNECIEKLHKHADSYDWFIIELDYNTYSYVVKDSINDEIAKLKDILQNLVHEEEQLNNTTVLNNYFRTRSNLFTKDVM